MKKIISCLLFLFQSSFVFSSSNKGLMILPDYRGSHEIALENQQTTVLTGKVCGVKFKKNNENYQCEKIHYQMLDVKFFYPDSLTEVTDQVELKVNQKEIEYSFATPELDQSQKSSFTVLVTLKDKFHKTKKVLKLREKLARHRQHFEKQLSKVQQDHQRRSFLVSAINLLRSIEQKLDHTLTLSSEVLARLETPLQIDNQYTKEMISEALFNDYRFYLKSKPGSLIEGEKVKIEYGLLDFTKKIDLSILGYQKETGDITDVFHDDRLKLLFSYNGESIKTINLAEVSLLEDIHEVYISDKLFSNKDHLVSLGLYRTKKSNNPSFGKKDFWGQLSMNLPLSHDQTPPFWTNLNPTEHVYTTNLLNFSSQVNDSFGRIDQDSIRAFLEGPTNVEMTSLLEIESLDRERSFEIRGTTSSLMLSEGDYQLRLLAQDLAGNSAQLDHSVVNFSVDRTAPQIISSLEDGILTNNPQLALPLSLLDHSPASVQVYLNNALVLETNETDFIADINLVEGNNIVDVFAVDAAGNVAEPLIFSSIMLDTIAPEILQIKPADGTTLFDFAFNIEGNSNEELSKIVINDQEFEVFGDQFSLALFHPYEGAYALDMDFYDLAGNKTTLNHQFDILLKVLNENLISIEPLNNGKLRVQGMAYSAKPGIMVKVDGGFFNTQTVQASSDGRFSVDLNYFTSVHLSARDSESGRSDSFSFQYNADTTLSGIVKDTNGRPLYGVTVSIVGTDHSVQTDASGSFSLANPITGDQLISFDGSSVPVEFSGEDREFASVNIAYSIGTTQLNVMENTVYLAPLLKDGSETVVEDGQAVTVESPHAPGVVLRIPAETAIFPDGKNSGAINIIEISSEVTTIPVPDFAVPQNVYAFEPSGLKFNEPVELTLPNVNEIPEGTQVVIMSKNSEAGIWEIDGFADVDIGGQSITTQPGQGITHFSEIYAVPLAPRFEKIGGAERPGADIFTGTSSTSVSLPSYKSMGQDIAASLIYQSNWANPNIVLTNMFDVPKQTFEFLQVGSKRNLLGKGSFEVRSKSWIVPDFLDVQFYSNDFVSEKMRFQGLPSKSVVSYAMDLSDVESGVQPYQSRYEMHLKNMVVTTISTKSKSFLGGSKSSFNRSEKSQQIAEVFPSDISGILINQNKKDSSFGAGWKLNFTSKIMNKEGSRLAVENQDGSTSLYTLFNKIETLYKSDKDFFLAANIEQGENFLVLNNKIDMYRFDSQSKELSPHSSVSQFLGVYGFSVQNRWPDCNYYRRSWSRYRHVEQMIELPNGDIFFTDRFGQLFKYQNGGYSHLAGGFNGVYSTTFSENNFCSTTGVSCSSHQWVSGWDCWYAPGSYGSYQANGYREGSLGNALFNTPKAMAVGQSASTLYVADHGNHRIRKVDLVNNTVSTFAGNGQTFDNGDGGPALSASLFRPQGLVFDQQGNLLVTTQRGYIRQISPSGVITTYAGKSLADGGVFTDRAHAENMVFNSPYGMVIDEQNNYLYVADTGHHRVVRIDMTTKMAETVAGRGDCQSVGDIGDGGAALAASLCSPKTVGLDAAGNLLIFDDGHKSIRKVTFSDGGNQPISYYPVADDGSELIKNQDGSFDLIYRSGVVSSYDQQGLLSSTQDRIGNITQYFYDGEGRLLSVVDPAGQETMMYYSSGLLSSIVDPSGRQTNFFYQGQQLTEIQLPDQSIKRFEYDNQHLLLAEIDQRGARTDYFYNEWNRLFKIVRPDQNEILLSDKGSQTIGNQYTNGQTGEVKYLDEGLYDGIKNAKGIETRFDSDENGYVSSITDGDGRVTQVERDLKGRPLKITRPDQTTTLFTYDELTGDLVKELDVETGIELTYQYNDFGALVSQTDFRGNAAVNVYDPSSGLLLSSTNVLGQTQQATYNQWGLVETQTSSIGQVKSYAYDQYGNVASTTAADGSQTHYQRDLAGNVISLTNAKNQVTSYQYDAFNRLISVTTPKNETTSYSYLSTGQLSQIVDPTGNVTSFSYDLLGRLIEKTDPLGMKTALTYDANDNVVSEVDPMGNLKTFEYDHLDQLVRKILPDDQIEMNYDVRGNLIEVQNQATRISFEYARYGKDYLLYETTTQGLGAHSDLPTFTLEYDYDAGGNRIAMQTPVGLFDYQYDQGNRLVQVINHKDEIFGMSYDNANRLTEITRPGSRSVLNFDVTSFLTQLVHRKTNNDLISGYDFQRDAIGNRTRVIASEGQYDYAYDANNQLLQSDSPVTAMEQFDYDPLGNRITDTTSQYVYDQKRQRLVEDFRFFYYYDNNGNLSGKVSKTSSEVTNFIHNTQNQLIGIESFDGQTKTKEVRYVYDVLGRRVQKQITDLVNAANSHRRSFGYDGQDLLFEFNESNDLLATYTHSGLRMDDILSADFTAKAVDAKRSKNDGSYFYLKDALGSVKEISDSQGNIVQQYAYSAFGELISVRDGSGVDIRSNPNIAPYFTYTARELDAESGLYYYRARYYDASVGRFLQVDPHPGVITHTLTFINKYIYVTNNPLKLVDPSGQFLILGGIAIGGLVKGALVAGAIQAVLTGALTGDWSGGNLIGSFARGTLTGLAIGTGGALAGFGATAFFGAGQFTARIAGAVAGGAIGAALGSANNPNHRGLGAFLGVVGGGIGGFLSAGIGINAARAMMINLNTSPGLPPQLAPRVPEAPSLPATQIDNLPIPENFNELH